MRSWCRRCRSASGHREDRQHPAVLDGGLRLPEDPPVTGGQVVQAGLGQPVAGDAGPPLGRQEAARLQPHQGLPDRRLADAAPASRQLIRSATAIQPPSSRR